MWNPVNNRSEFFFAKVNTANLYLLNSLFTSVIARFFDEESNVDSRRVSNVNSKVLLIYFNLFENQSYGNI